MGKRRIEPIVLAGLQIRCIQPLCHPSFRRAFYHGMFGLEDLGYPSENM